jgi:hypothetical protein
MSGNKSTTRAKTHGSVTRKTFLKQSSLSLLGLSLLPFSASSLNFNDQVGFIKKKGNNSDEKRLRSITYNVFNGCIGEDGQGYGTDPTTDYAGTGIIPTQYH